MRRDPPGEGGADGSRSEGGRGGESGGGGGEGGGGYRAATIAAAVDMAAAVAASAAAAAAASAAAAPAHSSNNGAHVSSRRARGLRCIARARTAAASRERKTARRSRNSRAQWDTQAERAAAALGADRGRRVTVCGRVVAPPVRRVGGIEKASDALVATAEWTPGGKKPAVRRKTVKTARVVKG